MKYSLDIEESVSRFVPSAFPETADLIVAYLEQIGVEYVFGVPGGAIEPLYNALARSQRRGRIGAIVARHESGAAFMADGYARDSGRLGVCCTTTGPGLTNAITGIASAYQDEIPLLVISAQTPLETFGRGAVQESSCTAVDTVAMLRHCTHYNTLVSHPAQLEYKLCAAITMAFQARGPVHLSIPLDLLRRPMERKAPLRRLTSLMHRPQAVDPHTLDALARRTDEARRIVIVAGDGCRGAVAPVLDFAKARGALIVTTPQGKGLIDPYHSHYRGGCGLAGHRRARDVLLDPTVDLVIVAGSSLDEQAGQGWLHDEALEGKLVHVDLLARHFVRSQHADLHVCGEVGAVFERLLARSAPAGPVPPPWDAETGTPAAVIPFERRARDRRLPRHGPAPRASERRQGDRRVVDTGPRLSRAFALTGEDKCSSADGPVKPQRLMHELSRLMPPGTRFLADIGNSFLWGLHYLHPNQSGDTAGEYFRTSMGFASMGWAIGAAVGTAVSDPSRPVVCIVGDGSYLMSGQEITTAVMGRLPVLFVILNDGALGTVKHGQRLARAERIGFELPPVDYAALARSMGVESFTVSAPADLLRIDMAALARRRAPCLIDVHVDGDETPPLDERMTMLAMGS